MAKGSAARAAKAASETYTAEVVEAGRKKLQELVDKNTAIAPPPKEKPSSLNPLRNFDVRDAKVLAVQFERGRALQIPGMGNAFEIIDTRPIRVPGGGVRPSKGAKFSLALSGPLLMVSYTRPDGVACVEGFPIVGNVRRITFDPAS